jgi:hypothetical protein
MFYFIVLRIATSENRQVARDRTHRRLSPDTQNRVSSHLQAARSCTVPGNNFCVTVSLSAFSVPETDEIREQIMWLLLVLSAAVVVNSKNRYSRGALRGELTKQKPKVQHVVALSIVSMTSSGLTPAECNVCDTACRAGLFESSLIELLFVQ